MGTQALKRYSGLHCKKMALVFFSCGGSHEGHFDVIVIITIIIIFDDKTCDKTFLNNIVRFKKVNDKKL